MAITSSENRLDGVQLDADLELSSSSSRVRIANGLTLNGTIRLTNHITSLGFEGTQTVTGTGAIEFPTDGSIGYLEAFSDFTTLTIGPELTIRGGNGVIGGSGGSMNVVNEGTIVADISGRTLTVSGQGPNATVTNLGTLRAINGGTLNVDNLTDNLGDTTLASDGHLDVDGNYTVDQAVDVVPGTTLSLGGSWQNGSTIDVRDATLNLAGSSSALGTITARDSELNVVGDFDTAQIDTIAHVNTTLGIGAGGVLHNSDDELVIGSTGITQLQLSGGTIHGGIISGAVHGSWVPGQIDTAITLDRQRFAEVPHSASLDIRRQITIETWIYADVLASVPIVEKRGGPSSSTVSYALRLNSNGQLQLDSASVSGRVWTLRTPFGSIEAGQWYHFAGVIDRDTGEIRAYLDGALVATSSVSQTDTVLHTGPLLIGKTLQNGVPSFEGRLDELRIWSTARTETQIQTDKEEHDKLEK